MPHADIRYLESFVAHHTHNESPIWKAWTRTKTRLVEAHKTSTNSVNPDLFDRLSILLKPAVFVTLGQREEALSFVEQHRTGG